MAGKELYYDKQGRGHYRDTKTADDVEDAATTEKLQTFKAPTGKPVQSKDETEPEKGTIQHMIWEKKQKAKAQGQSKALDKM